MALYDKFSTEGLVIEVHEGNEFQGRSISKNHLLLYALVGNNWATSQIPKENYNNPVALNAAVLSIKNRLAKHLASDSDTLDNFVKEVNSILSNKGTDKFQELVDICKGEVVVLANNYRTNHESIEEYIGDDRNDIEDTVWAKIIETQRVYRIQAYPETSVGFFTIFHYDFNLGVEQMIKIIKSYA